LLAALREEKEALSLVGRMESEKLNFESKLPNSENKDVVRLVIRDGVMVDIPVKDLVDSEKV
jgi:hypothetical protein